MYALDEYETVANISWIYALPIIWYLWKALQIHCWSFYMDEDSETIIERRGVFSVTTVEIQYFRIKSIQIWKPFFLRIFGLSTVQIITSEPFKPFLSIYAIYDGEGWSHYCKEMARYWRDKKGVKETDFHAF
jgi:membrane protein YdbS with pleckstrin-like domain